MRELDREGYKIVLTTHDEVGLECRDEEGEATLQRLKEIMTTNPPWAEGLPLAADVTKGYSYGK
jgi:DNA polymerase